MTDETLWSHPEEELVREAVDDRRKKLAEKKRVTEREAASIRQSSSVMDTSLEFLSTQNEVNEALPSSRMQISSPIQSIHSELAQSISSSYSYLQSHDVVLINGQVLLVNNLPKPSINSSKVFFRVLYSAQQQGKSSAQGKSSLFQCKTTVYESEITSEIANRVQWDQANFTFEVDKMLQDSFNEIPVQGDMLIVIYKKNDNGSNEFLGQIVISLQKLCMEGIPTMHEVNGNTVEKRRLKSIVNVHDRNGSALPGCTSSIQLCVSWKRIYSISSESSISLHSQRLLSRTRGGDGSSPRSNGVTTLNAVSVNNPSKVRPASASRLNRSIHKVPNIPKKTVTAVTEMPKRLSKAQKEFQWKVERENKAMANRLSKHETKNTSAQDAYNGNNKRVSVHSDHALKGVSERREGSKVAGIGAIGVVPSMSIPDKKDAEVAKLLEIFNKNKAELAALCDENKGLRNTLSRLTIQARQYESTQDRLIDPTGGGGGGGHLLAGQSLSTNAPNVSCHLYLHLLETNQKQPKDMELGEILSEYQYLQETRRSLTQRIVSARNTLESSKKSIQTEESKLEKFERFVISNNELSSSSSSEDMEKIHLLKELNKCKIELISVNSMIDLELLDDGSESILELQVSIDYIKEFISKEKKTFEFLEYERDLYREKLQDLQESGAVDGWKKKIMSVRQDIVMRRVDKAIPALPSLAEYA